MTRITMRPPARLVALGVTALAAIALIGCTATPGGDSGVDKYAELDLAITADPGSWNPALKQSASDGVWNWHAVYDTLLRCDAEGNVTPNAAESFELNADATELTLKLREGMTFSDGTAVDAAAVKASIENMQSPLAHANEKRRDRKISPLFAFLGCARHAVAARWGPTG